MWVKLKENGETNSTCDPRSKERHLCITSKSGLTGTLTLCHLHRNLGHYICNGESLTYF